jgi:hypothetical protein
MFFGLEVKVVECGGKFMEAELNQNPSLPASSVRPKLEREAPIIK